MLQNYAVWIRINYSICLRCHAFMYSRDESDASPVIHIHGESPFIEESTASHQTEMASTTASTTASTASSTDGITFLSPSYSETRWVEYCIEDPGPFLIRIRS